MKPRIAIPVPHSTDVEYSERAWPQYAAAVEQSGGEAIKVPLNLSQVEVAKLIRDCEGFLLPGSGADVNPQKYGQEADPECKPADRAREAVDELLLQEAHNLYKPLLCICFGVQSLNVWRGGTLLQDLAVMPVNHAAGKSVAVAHMAAIAPDSLLGEIVAKEEVTDQDGFLRLPVNSSHHQAIGIAGDGLRINARCPQDAVVEGVEGGQASAGAGSHFVLGLQWHPERSTDLSPTSRAIFKRFVSESARWTPRAIHISVAV
jgi:putative glutamine amidotransferase